MDFSYDPNEPAEIPVNVPKLPTDFRPTSTVETLQRCLLENDGSQVQKAAVVGFWGMGGIGKSVTGAALVRDDAVRAHFHRLLWLPLGQMPVMENLQSLALEQLNGQRLDKSKTEQERCETLRVAFRDKRVLLVLDDCWEQEHQRQLDFVDASCGSRVLISTRIRQVLSSAAVAIEIKKPTLDDSIAILLAAAGLGNSVNSYGIPKGAAEIAQLCGCLPLALGIAGKLVVELGFESGNSWEGVETILREELRGSTEISSEQGVIRASLAGLRGRSRDIVGAKNVFKLFGLVPEDTTCPLECLQLMYDAVYEIPAGKPTSVLYLRRWLKMLIDRSLVLGTVDRASLHDLVLDFTIAMYSEAELARAHRQVIESLRKNRPTNAAGVSIWDAVFCDDAVTAYVMDNSLHHVRESHQGATDSNDLLMSWLVDQPQDLLSDAVAAVLGEEQLTASAEAAEVSNDMWMASCLWAAAAAFPTAGIMGNAALFDTAARSISHVSNAGFEDASSFGDESLGSSLARSTFGDSTVTGL